LSATNSFTVTVNVPATTPLIKLVTVADDVATITWNTVAGHTYRLQYKDNLTETYWTDLLPEVPATGPTATVYNSVGGSMQRFYQVILVQ